MSGRAREPLGRKGKKTFVQQRKRTAPKRMGDVLNGLLARRGYAREQAAAADEQAWREAVGEPLAGQSRSGELRRGVLEIIVRNSAVLQELAFQKKCLLEKLVRANPDRKITDLRFRVGQV